MAKSGKLSSEELRAFEQKLAGFASPGDRASLIDTSDRIKSTGLFDSADSGSRRQVVQLKGRDGYWVRSTNGGGLIKLDDKFHQLYNADGKKGSGHSSLPRWAFQHSPK